MVFTLGASALLFTAAGDIANSLAQVNFVGPLPANEQALRTAFGSSGFAIGRATLHALAGCIGNAVAGQSCGSGAAGAFVGKLAQLSFADSSFANSEFGRTPEGGFIIAATAGCAGGLAGGGGATGCGSGAAMAAAGYLFNHLMHENTPAASGLHRRTVVRNDDGVALFGLSFGIIDDENPFTNNFFTGSFSGAPGSGREGNGQVYIDMNDPTTTTVRIFRTTTAEDKLIVSYMQSQVGNTAPYNALTNSCRDYSATQFDKIQAVILRARATGTTPRFK